MDQNVISGVVAAAMLSILAIGGLQMQISPNIWVMINTLQILRTVLLLKVNLPIGVRQVIQASSMFASFEFGLTSFITSEPSSKESIMQIMDGDDLLGQYFEEYGIETYRFIDYVISLIFDVVLLFLLSTFGIAFLSYIYMK